MDTGGVLEPWPRRPGGPRVVVVGAGPTGVTAAIMLAQRGIECLVLDRRAEPYPMPRAVHFDDEVFRVFAGLGLGDRLREISRPAAGLRLADRRLRTLAEFTRDAGTGEHGYPQANMFDQPALERLLRSRLAQLPGARLCGGVEVHAVEQVAGGAAPVRVRYRDPVTGAEGEAWADAVLGCDGAGSGTRGAVGARLEDLGFTQRWLVVDVRSRDRLDAYDGVLQVCDHERAATFMMVTPGRYRWEFRLDEGTREEELTDARVLGLIRPWLGAAAADGVTVLRRAAYTFRGAVADRWRDRRVFLLGDAAHLTPPFIGQGLCAGIRDAANLTWKLALVLTGGADERLLDTYEAERRPYARRVVRMAILVGWLMTGGSARTAALRRAAMRTVSRLPPVRRKALATAWPAFPPGALVAGRGAGRLCPQPRLRDGRLLDEALGTGFAVIHSGRTGPALGATVLDARSDPALAGLLGAAGTGALLLRPDRVVAATGDPRAWRALLESAGITVGPPPTAAAPPA